MALDEPARAATIIGERAPGITPRVALVLGSGLGPLADSVDGAVAISYADLPGFPQPGVEGHAGRLVLGRLGGVPVACLQGRAHAYEGRGYDVMATAVRTMQAIGCELIYLTCAAGSLRREVDAGRLMTITDHINLQGGNPLVGPNDDAVGPRFPPMVDAYDPAHRARQHAAAAALGIDLAEGVYCVWLGPSFETPAEVRMIKMLGADAVGMSTVPESILARHCGLQVTATAVITNLGVGLSDEPVDHDQTLRAATAAGADLARLIVRFLEDLPAPA
ncbi:MAG: purine-nucleoside phosphorylase [Alphaproteobacteria bacterium]